MSEKRIFVSHAHQDAAYCRQLVAVLHSAGADVWYDEHNLGPGHLMSVIQRELEERPYFIVILSPSAFASDWVRDECTWAYSLSRRDQSRVILPVTAVQYDVASFAGARLALPRELQAHRR